MRQLYLLKTTLLTFDNFTCSRHIYLLRQPYLRQLHLLNLSELKTTLLTWDIFLRHHEASGRQRVPFETCKEYLLWTHQTLWPLRGLQHRSQTPWPCRPLSSCWTHSHACSGTRCWLQRPEEFKNMITWNFFFQFW